MLTYLRNAPWRYAIPNGITCLAIFFAFVSAKHTIDGNYQSAAWFIIFSFITDTMDGGVARLLNASSRFGQELDSLADIINLGVVPGLLIAAVYEPTLGWGSFILGFVQTIAVAFRLARFNIVGKANKAFFIGLPSPHTAAVVSTFILFSDAWWGEYRYPIIIVILVPVMALMMLSNLRYESSYFIKPGKALDSWQGCVFVLSVVIMIFVTRHFYFLMVLGVILSGVQRSIREKLNLVKTRPSATV